MANDEFEAAFANSVAYVTRMLEQAHDLQAYPIALLIGTPKGMMLLIDQSFPRECVPSPEDWAALRPDGRNVHKLFPAKQSL